MAAAGVHAEVVNKTLPTARPGVAAVHSPAVEERKNRREVTSVGPLVNCV